MRVDNALNCPLCDSDDVGVYSDMMGGLSVGCNDCGCEGPTRDTRDEAIAAWNKRPKLTLAAPDLLAACEDAFNEDSGLMCSDDLWKAIAKAKREG